MNELIKEAKSIPCTEWYRIDSLIEKAPDAETKEKLRWIQIQKSLREEYECV